MKRRSQRAALVVETSLLLALVAIVAIPAVMYLSLGVRFAACKYIGQQSGGATFDWNTGVCNQSGRRRDRNPPWFP